MEKNSLINSQGKIILCLAIVLYSLILQINLVQAFDSNTLINFNKCYQETANYTNSNDGSCLLNHNNTYYVIGAVETTQDNLYDGDCFDYSELYKAYFEENDYLTKKVSIFSEDNTAGHTFLIAYDKNLSKYCRIDQKNINCVEMA